MIAYFDTSAVIPLVIEEPSSDLVAALFAGAEHLVSSRLVYPEGRAALAQAARQGRLRHAEVARARRAFEAVWNELGHLEVTPTIAVQAGDLAEGLGLRGYDAVHLASAASLGPLEVVVVATDRSLLDAAGSIGLAVARC